LKAASRVIHRCTFSDDGVEEPEGITVLNGLVVTANGPENYGIRACQTVASHHCERIGY
jgi:hypothetical protein